MDELRQRLDANPEAMHIWRGRAEYPFGTNKASMGATHLLMKLLPNVAAKMALKVLVYNRVCVVNIVGRQRLIAAIRTG